MDCSNGHANYDAARFCSTCGVALTTPSPAAPVNPNPPPATASGPAVGPPSGLSAKAYGATREHGWWPPANWGPKQAPVAAAVIIIVFCVIVFVTGGDERNADKADSGGSTELCAALRDPENRQLTLGDWERITDLEDWEIQRYVRQRCPEQYDRVD